MPKSRYWQGSLADGRIHGAHAPTVIKIGGAVVGSLGNFWPQVRTLQAAAPVVIVHGGGGAASSLARRLGHKPRIVQGRRVTTALDLQIVEWTLRGGVNLDLVGQAQATGIRSVGLSGADGSLLTVTRRTPWIIDGETIDFGWVGEIQAVRTSILTTLLDAGYLPVVAPIGVDTKGRRYNVNADTVASALAAGLCAHTLILVTETGGIRRRADAPATRVPRMDTNLLRQGEEEGWITGGMRVKGQVALAALHSGVHEAYIAGPSDIAARTRATQIVL